MKKLLYLLVAVVIAGGLYYWFAMKSGSVVVQLQEQNASGETGTVTLTEMDGTVQATLVVSGQPAGVVQPAHIHKGSCPNPGAVAYPLTFPKDGEPSVTSLDVSMADLKAQAPLAVHVHKSVAEASVYAASGNIRF